MIERELKRIVDGKFYVGSGVEDVIDDHLHTKLDEYGQYSPDYSTASDSDAVLSVMMNSHQSRSEDDMAEGLFSEIPNIQYDQYLGYYSDLYVGYVEKGTYRKSASSGGFVSWLATKLLDSGDIDAFIHVKKSTKPGILFEYGISRTVEEIRSGAKSRYYPVELSSPLKEVKNTPGKYAVVGIPEIITELRMLAEQDEAINERVQFYFGLVCGHQKTTKYAEAIAWEYGIKPGDLEDIDFRVKKATGRSIEYDMKFTGLVDGKKRTFTVRNNEPFVSSWAHGFFKARFSDFTDNSFNELADITFGDAWLEEYAGDPMGNNILIVRNERLAEVIREGEKKNEIKVDSVDSETINRSQRGLIHHTRDELPYRLAKELEGSGWAPGKRVEPSDSLNAHRKDVQDVRQLIAEKSHELYREAVLKDDFGWFKRGMKGYVQRYDELYGQPKAQPKSKLKEYARRVQTRKERQADGAIITLTGYFNYGNVIQRYALQKYLQDNGRNFISIVRQDRDGQSHFPVGRRIYAKAPLRFIKRFMKYQKPYWYIPKVDELYPEMHRNKHLVNFVNENIWIKSFEPGDDYKTYIVGSDQVWRNWWGDREIAGYYFFNFLKSRKAKRISYAASFGKDKIEEVMSNDDVEYISPYIGSFDAISVREKSGEALMKDAWGIKNAKTVVDPTLLLTADVYSSLIEKTDVRYQKIQPIFTYMLGETDQLKSFVRKVQDERKQAVTSIRAHAGAENDILPPVELWLKGFRDADLAITNSFHGMMFAVINNTDFIVIGRDAGGLSRIYDFLDTYGIEGRFVNENDLDSFDTSKLEPINWPEVNKKVEAARSDSGKWLLESIDSAG